MIAADLPGRLRDAATALRARSARRRIFDGTAFTPKAISWQFTSVIEWSPNLGADSWTAATSDNVGVTDQGTTEMFLLRDQDSTPSTPHRCQIFVRPASGFLINQIPHQKDALRNRRSFHIQTADHFTQLGPETERWSQAISMVPRVLEKAKMGR